MEPCRRLASVQRESAKEHGVVVNGSARRAGVGKDQGWDHHFHRPPACLSRDHRTKASLHIEAADRVLKVAERRLDLNDHHLAECRTVRHEIDAAAVTVVAEAHLGTHLESKRREV